LLQGIAPERAGVASYPSVAHHPTDDEMIQKFKADCNRVIARLTVIGAEFVGLAAVPEAIVSREIFKVAFWKSLSRLERIETALEVYDYGKNLGETISDPLARDKTDRDALQKVVEFNLDWFTAHPQFYKVALDILAKGAKPPSEPTTTAPTAPPGMNPGEPGMNPAPPGGYPWDPGMNPAPPGGYPWDPGMNPGAPGNPTPSPVPNPPATPTPTPKIAYYYCDYRFRDSNGFNYATDNYPTEDGALAEMDATIALWAGDSNPVVAYRLFSVDTSNNTSLIQTVTL
jgi:hypothetical protein